MCVCVCVCACRGSPPGFLGLRRSCDHVLCSLHLSEGGVFSAGLDPKPQGVGRGAHRGPWSDGYRARIYPRVTGTWSHEPTEGGGVGTRPWWLALLACGGAYWHLAFEPSAMTSRHPYYCGRPHCRRHPPSWGGGDPECNFCPWRPPLTA